MVIGMLWKCTHEEQSIGLFRYVFRQRRKLIRSEVEDSIAGGEKWLTAIRREQQNVHDARDLGPDVGNGKARSVGTSISDT